ncbi:short chain dehydrogenase [Pedobacter fastidiosus]|uniref:Short chain dehydrogenase n=1 Tax=Pedobacter fastidiosus TaxID=2765361 RepID=A0ABR7KWB8_9SPHI|nr:short chain dehydrogenase [Pedobacter fastidiosus]MBC6112406.1 short chain dehydrogenase [Pedobacter fastidiosus]
MKIIIIGATGTIGKHVVNTLQGQHEIIKVGSKSGDILVDIGSVDAIKKMFETIGSFDALVSVAGTGHVGPLHTMTDVDFRKTVDSKLMGQVNLVLIGQHYINPSGSFTLTSGSLAHEPVLQTASLSSINAAVDGFIRGAAIELKNAVRINSVSPTVVEESPDYFPFFPGTIPVSMEAVAAAYNKSVLGAQTGQVYKIW